MCLGGWTSQQQRLKKQITADTPPPPPGRATPAVAALPPSPPDATIAYIRHLLQICIEIEHSTIPLYLTAVYSMRNTSSWEHGVILGVVIEEMLHMTNVANLLNAIGGHPDISKPDFVPNYPITIPVINISAGISPFGKSATATFEQVESGFEATKTIRATYTWIAQTLRTLCQQLGEKTVFSGEPALQVRVTAQTASTRA